MNNPELYNKNNRTSKQIVTHFLEEYAGKIKWKNSNESVMDVGSGDGSVTTIIKMYIPTEDVRFVASDINEEMVKYANEHYSKENITFRVLDIEDDLPNELKHNFNHVFSFFVLHLIKNQEKALRNIYNLLTKGGDCFLIIIKSVPYYYDIIKQASENIKFKGWIDDVNRCISPYYDVEHADEKLAQMLKTIGFTDIDVQCKTFPYVMKNGSEFKSLMEAIQPFNMPKDVFEEFAKDSVPLAKQLGLLDQSCSKFEDHDKAIDYNYVLLVVHATKN